jgi:hypothetical protein
MTRRSIQVLAGIVLLAAPAGSIVAQPRADLQAPPRFTLDVGANSVSWTAFPGALVPSPRQSGVSITPGVHLDGAGHTIDAAGSWASDPTGGGILQGSGLLSLYTPSRGLLRGEFTASANGSRLADGFASARAQGGVRVHAGAGRAGAWLGGSAGTAGYDSTWRQLRQAEAGAWLAFPAGALVLSATPTRLAFGNVSDRFTDIEAGARIVRNRAELGLAFGSRTGRSTAIAALGGASVWGTVAATIWMTPTVALTSSAGTYPVDAAMRFPGGQFVSAGMRVAFDRVGRAAVAPVASRATSTTDRRESSDAPGIDGARPALTIFSGAPGAPRTVRVVVSSAVDRVEVAGSFNNWEPVPLERTRTGEFRTTLNLPAGRHEIAVRVNGGAWMAPAGLVALRDEFGGESGVLMVDR